ncbi:MAG: DUF1858 domain-containing protein [Bacteroidales bacterium]|nr:DUF1858 domain-containing protein [Bacteroidales bacterium]
MEKLIITPKTKIFDLLSAYPDLEEVLIESTPQFKKLRNPVLRKTITKITNLSQAAAIAHLKVEDLVNKLRAQAGQDRVEHMEDQDVHFTLEQPDWFDESHLVQVIDIRDMLHTGEQPVHEVLSALKKLEDRHILKIVAPFIPAPLIDKATSLNFQHWLDQKSGEEYWIYFSQ